MEHTIDTVADAPYWMATPSKPKLRLPAGTCDAHVHVFGPRARFPFAEGRGYTPSDAPKDMLFRLHEQLGIQHCVVVQPACHGFDNSVTADATVATGGCYKGVALVPLTVSDAELKRLDAAGLCGARFHYMGHLVAGPKIDDVIVFAKRLADLGWHLQIHMESTLIEAMTPILKRSAVPVVIDHMGRLDAGLGLSQAPFQSLRRLIDNDGFWVKVSGCDRITRTGPPYADALAVARQLVAEFPDRVLWGTDWPHPHHAGPIPDDGLLVDMIADMAPSEALRRQLMVENPRRLYDRQQP